MLRSRVGSGMGIGDMRVALCCIMVRYVAVGLSPLPNKTDKQKHYVVFPNVGRMLKGMRDSQSIQSIGRSHKSARFLPGQSGWSGSTSERLCLIPI